MGLPHYRAQPVNAVWGNSQVRSGQVRVRVTLQLTVSQPVCLGVEPNLGQLTRVYFLLEISFRQCNFVAPSLTRGRVCKLLYNCFWALPEQSLLGREKQSLFTVRTIRNTQIQSVPHRKHITSPLQSPTG
jgi:hypothetical protein